MLSKIKNGSIVDVQGLKCQLPPVGYLKNILTGDIEYRGVISRSPVAAEQYWERKLPPTWLNKRLKEETIKRKIDPAYVDKELEAYKAQEWDRRLNGCWFMNNGVAVYLTGMHYLYLQWWSIDIGYVKFRIPDLEYFYFLQYCIEDSQCLGMLEVTKRRFGKTYRAGLFAYEYASRTTEAMSGVQSKTNADGKKFFNKAIIRPFRKLPSFFRPEYDLSQGINPKSELRFQHTNIRGKAAEELLDKDELGSVIDYQSSELLAYDGQKLQSYVRDECLKTFEVDVYEGLDVIRYCLMDDEGRIIGKALYTSTVEIEEDGKKGKKRKPDSVSEQAGKKLWDDSDHLNKKSKQTESGLYRFFMPAQRARCFDKYGYPNVEKAIKEILQDRKTVENNPKRLAARRRKEPMKIEEAFMTGAGDCHFNANLLNDRVEFLAWNKGVTQRGNFIWKDGIPYTTVQWVKDENNGRWERCWSFPEKGMANNIEARGNLFFPKNHVQMISACDPYQNDVTEDTRNSMGGSHVFMRHDNNKAESIYSRSFICQYNARPKMVSLFYEDMIKQCFFFGTQLLYESNKPGIKTYFIDHGCEPFLIRIPGYKDYGIPSTTENKSLMVNLWEEYIQTHSERLFFLKQCEQLLKFDVNNTKPSDLAMSGGWALVADFYRRHTIKEAKSVNINDYFRQYKTA